MEDSKQEVKRVIYVIRADQMRGRTTIRIYQRAGEPVERAIGRQCNICLALKFKEEMVHNKGSLDGMYAHCKECHKQKTRARLADPANRKRYNEVSRKWKNRNQEKNCELSRSWKKANPEKTRLYASKQRAQRFAAEQGFRDIDWENVKNYFDNRCPLTHRSDNLHMEHFVPLSKGGSHSRGNVIPLNGTLNTSKHDRNPFEWILDQPIEIQERFQDVVEYLAAYNHMSIEEYRDYVDLIYWIAEVKANGKKDCKYGRLRERLDKKK